MPRDAVWVVAMSKSFAPSLNRRERMILLGIIAASVVVWGWLVVSAIELHGMSVEPASYVVTASVPASATESGDIITPAPIPTFTPSPMPTATPLNEATRTPTPTPTPDEPRLLTLPPDTTVIALLGTDEDRSAGIWRTDTIILTFVVPSNRRIALLSIPRDLWVQIPGDGYGRINTVDALGERTQYPGGGPALLNETLEQNLGLSIDHYVRVDFQDFVQLVDAMGGVTVYVEQPIHDKFPDPMSPTGETEMDLSVGLHHMDGHMALCYCRSRMTTSDFDRSRRQQQVLLALWKQALTFDTIKKAPQLWAQFSDSFDTDLTPAQALQLASLARDIGTQNIRTRHLDFSVARPWTTPQGARVLLPDKGAIQKIVLEMVSSPPP